MCVFRHISCDVASRAGENAFDSRRVANQDDRIAAHTGFTPIIEFQQYGFMWCRSLQLESRQIGMSRDSVEFCGDALRDPWEIRRVRGRECFSTAVEKFLIS